MYSKNSNGYNHEVEVAGSPVSEIKCVNCYFLRNENRMSQKTSLKQISDIIIMTSVDQCAFTNISCKQSQLKIT